MMLKHYDVVTGSCLVASIASAIVYDRFSAAREGALLVAVAVASLAAYLFISRASSMRTVSASITSAAVPANSEALEKPHDLNSVQTAETSDAIDQLAFPFAGAPASRARYHAALLEQTRYTILQYYRAVYHTVEVQERAYPSVDTVVQIAQKLSTSGGRSFELVLTADGELIVRPSYTGRRGGELDRETGEQRETTGEPLVN